MATIYGLDVKVKGAIPTATNIEDMGRRAIEAEPALRKVFDTFLEAEQALFKRPGKKWAKNTKSTLKSKRGDKPNIDTGMLMTSLTVKGAPNQKRKTTDSYLVFGTTLHYATWADRGRGENQPARPLIRLRAADRKSMTEIIEDFLTKGANG